MYATTAAELIERFNESVTKDPIDYAMVADNLFAENDVQRRLVQLTRDAKPIFELSAAVRVRWGEELMEDSDMYSSAPAGPAELTEETDDRAQAVYTESDGTDVTLYLVRVGDRWWLSGYTLEYDPQLPHDPDSLIELEVYAELFAAVSTQLLPRVEGGEFETIEDFRETMMEELRQYASEHSG